MLNKYLPHIIIVGFIVLFVQGFFSPIPYDEGATEYRSTIDSLTQGKIKDLETINKLQNDKEEIKHFIPKDSLMVWDADRVKRDSIRSVLNPS